VLQPNKRTVHRKSANILKNTFRILKYVLIEEKLEEKKA
jgi:hypothetical protein